MPTKPKRISLLNQTILKKPILNGFFLQRNLNYRVTVVAVYGFI